MILNYFLRKGGFQGETRLWRLKIFEIREKLFVLFSPYQTLFSTSNMSFGTSLFFSFVNRKILHGHKCFAPLGNFICGCAPPRARFTRVRQVRCGDDAKKFLQRICICVIFFYICRVVWRVFTLPCLIPSKTLHKKENNVIIKALAEKLLPQNNLMLTKLYNYAKLQKQEQLLGAGFKRELPLRPLFGLFGKKKAL